MDEETKRIRSLQSEKMLAMLDGDKNTIWCGLKSENFLIRERALFCAVVFDMRDSETIKLIEALSTDTSSMDLAYPIYTVALAALDRLDVRRYHGNESLITAMIKDWPYVPTERWEKMSRNTRFNT